MDCSEVAVGQVCFNNGTSNVTLQAHYIYGKNAAGQVILQKTVFTNAAGVPVDTSGGTVTAGACSIAAPDVEQQIVCDVQADGSVVEFVRRTITAFDSTGAATTTVTNVALDYVTAYTPTGTVGACGQDCDPVTAVGVVSTWG